MRFQASPMRWVSFAMIVGVMGTALISPLYGLYQSQWQLQPSDVSLIYVVYMAGALMGLLFLGRLPDRVGFRRVMQGGLVLMLLGTAGTAMAWNGASLNVARFFVGMASSLLITSSSTGFLRLSSPVQLQRVAGRSGFLIAFGFGLGPLVGGIFGQWVPYPLVSTFLPSLLLCALGLWVISRLPLPPGALPSVRVPLRWDDVKPRMVWPTGEAAWAFVLAVCVAFLAFGMFGLYAAMAPLFLAQMLPWHGPMVSGAAVAVILFASAGVQVLAGRLPVHWCGFYGLLLLVLSNAVLLLNAKVASVALFAVGVLITAVGHGMASVAGISMVNRLAGPQGRSGLMASYLVVGYVGGMVPVMGMGWVADHWGMPVALATFCGMVMVLGSLNAVLFQRHPLMRAKPGLKDAAKAAPVTRDGR